MAAVGTMTQAGISAGGCSRPQPNPQPKDIWATLDEPWCEQSQSIAAGLAVLINEAEPTRFLAHLWTGLRANAALILANPSWRHQEWQQVAQQLCPDIVLGETPPVSFKSSKNNASRNRPQPGQILIATGGTSGQIKFVVHTWSTLTAAAQGFLDHFSQRSIHKPVNSYCVLPLYHVSGLMQAMRVWLSGGQLVTQQFKQLETGQRRVEPDDTWFISLVPTQLQRLIEDATTCQWLSQFRAILLGGAPAWPSLMTQAARLPIALTYGMSETAAQVATLLPQDFQSGVRSQGSPLPHVTLAIHQPESAQPQPLGSVGRIALRTPSLAMGYWLDAGIIDMGAIDDRQDAQPWFYPDDLGYLDQRGHLHVVGRNSQKIITGGENVFPAEVEAALLSTGLVQDVCVVGLPDPVWGQAVAALYVSEAEAQVTPLQLKTALKTSLSAYKHPKHWRLVDHIPRNAQGKVNRSRVVAQLSAATELAQD
ncbi:AMP-binding protein [Leptolyngbya cf. ectocarpi LEGE 11479]|uniref:AMP-binding protein n=1 Tax=Leptolyngbya cf. ectocarpi LEGE 11479 TaxID=1828722 RepID=A0A928ZZZ9_LEPEC|nr:AMP-binding protein [Leptolyngbya ectocarpi]MBE9070511.1 AMP-binding protein [Leptolyngbya cf. ectocarpi LEGE 11479]